MESNVKKEDRLEFYGGSIGNWIPLGSLVVFMLILVITDHVNLKIFWTAGFFSMCLSFLMAKNKKKFDDVVVKGLTDPMFSTLVMIFFLAGVLSYALRQSGLINGLLWLCTEIGASGTMIPAVTFIVCLIIGTSCGTSGGTVAAATPIMLPLGVSMGVNPALLLGAIASGAFFGDNLAPISDTTISSATTMDKDVTVVVKSRLPYSLIAGTISLILFIFLGITTTDGSGVSSAVDADSAKTLVMLVIPLLMIILMLRGQSLVTVLLICDMVALALNVVMGFIPVGNIFSTESPIVAGIESMLSIVCFEVFLFALLALTKESGAFDRLLNFVLEKCRSERQVESVTAGMIIVATAVTAINTVAIVIVGPIANQLYRRHNLDRAHGANILDGLACAMTGLIPYNATMMTLLTMAVSTGVIAENFPITSIIAHNFHCMGLLVLFVGSALTGIGRKYEKPENK